MVLDSRDAQPQTNRLLPGARPSVCRAYLPIDQHGADLLFQVISQRYERGSIVLTTNKPFKQWASIFNNDSTIASAVLDRLLQYPLRLEVATDRWMTDPWLI